MERVLVSACLLGERVRYDGRDAFCGAGILLRWRAEDRLIPLCPEVAGGLPVPRPAAEIQADGRVMNRDGEDVTPAFQRGAEEALACCRLHGIRVAILKEGSPSCGVLKINDGRFSGIKVNGRGVTTRLLEANGIHVFSEQQLKKAADYVAELEEAA